MRKPRDYDSELKALTDKAKTLKSRKVLQLGELVIATGADSLDPETLTGALLVIAETKESAKRESWRNRGAAFFRKEAKPSFGGTPTSAQGGQAQQGADAPG
jgi:DNA-binding protein H-NS